MGTPELGGISKMRCTPEMGMHYVAWLYPDFPFDTRVPQPNVNRLPFLLIRWITPSCTVL